MTTSAKLFVRQKLLKASGRTVKSAKLGRRIKEIKIGWKWKMMNHYNGVNYAINDANISAHVEHSMHMPHDHTLTSHMHSMSFHFGYNETVLFSFWITSSPIELIMACFLTIFMCFIMESIRWFRGIRPPHNVDLHMEQSAVVSIKFAPHITTAMCKDTILHAVQLIVSYVLMLLFMTFNIWICSATVFGEQFYKAISLNLSEEATEHFAEYLMLGPQALTTSKYLQSLSQRRITSCFWFGVNDMATIIISL
ncbi:hypothetical protein DINM_005152 [Dirofilaria immitis]|nr:hypothetical protein [Dirofilaria immitis]